MPRLHKNPLRPALPAAKAAPLAAPLRAVTLRATPAVLILLSLALIALSGAGVLPAQRLRTVVADAAAPVLSVVSAPFGALADGIGGMTGFRDLKAENLRLTAENARLQKWYEAALRLQAENKSFRELLNVKAAPQMSFVTARVISDAGGTFVKSVLLPVGTQDKVTQGDAVLSGHGLIGRVVEAGAGASRVLLVTDLNSHIPVVLQGTRIKAVLAGQNGALMTLERLPPDTGLTVGMRVVTSGDAGRLPPDIPVGTVVSVGAKGAQVAPIADIDTLAYVQVVNTAPLAALSSGILKSQTKDSQGGASASPQD